MTWRYGRWVVEHPLPLGASSRPAVGAAVRAGEPLASGNLRHFEVRLIPDPDTLLTVDEVLDRLAREDAGSAAVARLRLFAGLSVEEAAEALGVSRATAFRDWAYARAWLTAALRVP